MDLGNNLFHFIVGNFGKILNQFDKNPYNIF